MARHVLRIVPILLLVSVFISIAKLSAHSDSSVLHAKQPIYNASYRSRSSNHKVLIQESDRDLRESLSAEGASIIEDYGAFVLMSVSAAAAERVAARSDSRSSVRDDMNVLLLRAGALDTSEENASANSPVESSSANEGLYLVQFVGPIKKRWANQLASAAEIVSYIPNNAYLIRANGQGLAEIERLRNKELSSIQWTGPFRPSYRIAPEIALDSSEAINITVQLASNANTTNEIEDLILRSSASMIEPPTTVLNFTNVRIKVRAQMLGAIARMSNVVWIEQWQQPALHDEKQGLIVAGKLTGAETSVSSYLAWLQSKGITATPDFIVDVADTGIDRGVLDPQVIHKDFLNAAGLARVVYARYVGAADSDALPADTTGHGTINAAIVGGYNVGSSFPYVDADGYRFGLGIHPYAKLGATQIFAPDFTNPPLASMIDRMYKDGARISSNSWGSYNNGYTPECQLYDSLVRDSQPSVQGNQEMTVIFSSGNKGPGGNLSSPGTAKNVITVGASESLRPGIDGCQIGTNGADDINSLIYFSSGGPTADGRVKPDIVAPGTHIEGARSQSPAYTGKSVCALNYPAGQTLYTWSSGTSHSAPAVAGGAALVRQFFQQSVGHAPSSAMVKAYLTNSTTYLTGLMAGDTLPGNNQGWGLMNVGRVLDGVPRILIDQDQVLSDTGQVITVKGKIADASKPFRVTLAWTDAPGNPAADPSVNDLDLQVDVGGKTYLGNVFAGSASVSGGSPDRHNNLESVWLPAGVTGDFTVRVVAANIAGDGVPGNTDTTDQDFALVVYNAGSQTGGGGGPVDLPPTLSLIAPTGGERFLVGSTVRIQWTASDDKGLQSQRVEFSPDGNSFTLIAALDGNARSLDWKVPQLITTAARIRVTVLDGVNLPVSSINPNPFAIENGPPDTTPPSVTLLSHNGTDPVGGGLPSSIKWKESDNVGVVRRVIEISDDNGNSFQQITSLAGPLSGDTQTYDWQVPADLWTGKAKVRITVYDGAGNSATAASRDNFEVWPMPIVNDVTFTEGNRAQLDLAGRYFRADETEIWVDGVWVGRIQYSDKYFTGNGTYKHISSLDKKLNKRVPDRTWVKIDVRIPRTGQISPAFEFRRKKPLS